MAEESLARRIAASVLNALKSEEHILVERGGQDAVIRELSELLAAPLPRIVARAARAPVSGEVTSTFGDEATDEAVEELVEALREAIVESEHVEDVFAEDRELDRRIFRLLHDELLEAARSDEEETGERVPISVRLDTLGYVAATAAQRADEAVVRGALERAAKAADGELERFEPSARIALFALTTEDADRRLEVEEAVAEELVSLVTEGAVELPTLDRRIPLSRELNALEWRAARGLIDAVAKRLLDATGVPSTWRPEGASAIRLSFTPLSEKDAELVGEIATAFQRDVDAMIGGGPGRASREPEARGLAPAPRVPAPREKAKLAEPEPPEVGPDVPLAPKKAASEKARPKKATPTRRALAKPAEEQAAASSAAKKTAAKKTVAKKTAAKKTSAASSPAKKSAAKTTASAPKRPAPKP